MTFKRFIGTEQVKWYRAEVVSNGEVCFVTNPSNFPIATGDELSIDLSFANNPIVSNVQHGFYIRVRVNVD